MNSTRWKVNNFDLLRIVAATQVLVMHGIEHLNLSKPALQNILSHFPGVPIFFVISGFLISASYERNPDLRSYFRNRALRIFPALWACLAFSIFLASVVGDVAFNNIELIPWLLAQVSFLQFYNPDFLRSFGVGVLNGSLWTISVELQFYVALPLIYRWLSGNPRNAILITMTILLGALNFFILGDFFQQSLPRIFQKISQVVLPTYLYLFLVGILIQRNYLSLQKYLEKNAIIWTFTYCVLSFSSTYFFSLKTGNEINPVLATLLAFTVVSWAVSWPNISSRLLRTNDFSYGIYIYHMPIINTLIFLKLGGAKGFTFALALTAICAILSWLLIERPMLRLKRNPLHAVKPSLNL
ncbi:acyltransferase [Pigmentiphaga sp. YJ18]|uniref:acyltransferase family protein n=1 Tax=Pigmentiphaga sp. YJ18 TaxID=3134907 RepID=UPI00311098ED